MNKYEKIANEMRKRIKSSVYDIDQPIPDEKTLAAEFGCSRMTMKRALDTLAAEGMLFRKRGHGTFIIQSAMQDEHVHVVSNEILGLSNLLKGKNIKSKVIRFEVQFPSQDVAAHLAIDEKTPVYYVVRLRIVEGEPYVLEKTYMPASLIPGINDEVLNHSIYDHITRGLQLKIAGTHRKIRACKSDDMDQQYLGCRPDDPILEVEHVGFLDNGTPFEYSFSRHRHDKFVVTSVNIKRS
ncbi:GntR family transcriptional regulator [Bacillus amyloliquefaciens]|uniref:UTRA domain-containing protein n=2 Tax=Bacillus velezensis TaxID=492670 RepID=A0A6A8LI14_BACVE|nr:MULTISPECIES: GntR family transcriptional regulator [Bacillus]AIU76276.1 GntR family transcriptional regulator [Bacillus subtilis]COD76615.1 GntR family transcriptional regulator [Streptococcus pneumoniae]AGF28817.1 GntR family transcriptional regulator [Bacillus amyloliquefaciens IT-45]AHC41141.1 GntR family transcriptional regulator [Bacillus amyloliquefaciens LFB112]AJH22966.1 GntR family transcriptional regulator [Bacillus velezensis]